MENFVTPWPAYPLHRLDKTSYHSSRLAEYDDAIRRPLFSLTSSPQPYVHHCLSAGRD